MKVIKNFICEYCRKLLGNIEYILFIFIIIGLIGIAIKALNGGYSTEIKPNQIWMEIYAEDNPFKTPDTTYKKVLDVKENWVLYEYTNIFNEKDTNSTTKRFFLHKSSIVKEK